MSLRPTFWNGRKVQKRGSLLSRISQEVSEEKERGTQGREGRERRGPGTRFQRVPTSPGSPPLPSFPLPSHPPCFLSSQLPSHLPSPLPSPPFPPSSPPSIIITRVAPDDAAATVLAGGSLPVARPKNRGDDTVFSSDSPVVGACAVVEPCASPINSEPTGFELSC